MKQHYLAVLVAIALATPALQAQEKNDGSSTREVERVARAKKITSITREGDGVNGLQPGTPSPALSAESIDGTTVTLDDFRGKYILIDVWATWCGPCRAEIPYLKALEEKLHGKNIAFVSVSVDSGKEKWNETVKADAMTGVQAWIGPKDDFVTAYAITSIPRFILLDTNGNILDPNMKLRPSNPSLLPFLQSLPSI